MEQVRPPEDGYQSMVKLDKAVVLQVCDREPGDKRMPHGRLLIPMEYIHRPGCPGLDGDECPRDATEGDGAQATGPTA